MDDVIVLSDSEGSVIISDSDDSVVVVNNVKSIPTEQTSSTTIILQSSQQVE